MVRPHEKSSQFPSKETSKVERKELRQLLFDLDQAIRNGLFQRKVVGLWRLGVLPEVV